MASIVWRTPARADDLAWLDLLADIERADRRGETYTAEDLEDEWRSVWAHPATDAVHGWDGDRLVAFGWLKTQPGARDRHLIELWGGVRPSHRRQGIGTELLRRQVARAEQVAAQLDPRLPVEARVDAGSGQPDARRLAERHGFVAARTFLEVARPLAAPLPSHPVPPGLSLHRWEATWDERTRAAHAEAFAGTWGSEPRTVEEWQQWYTGHRAFRADQSAVLVDAAGEVQSFVLSAAYPQDWASEPRELWITTVGTRPAWRGRGAARAALAAVLQAAAEAGDRFERAILGVDRDNPTGALGLYRSLGFADVRSVTTLVRPLRA